MAFICPFRAYRYNPAIVGDFAKVVTQPFDKIGPDLQQEYCRRSPYNVVHITRSLEKNDNPDTDYAQAGLTYRKWIGDVVLMQEQAPAIYAYSQEYEVEGEKRVQRGFIALVDLRRSAAGIMPHERTLAEPKMDRLRLMRSIESNEDSIYMLYTDDKLSVDRVVADETSGRKPDIKVADDFGVVHRVWAIVNPKALKLIQDAMVRGELFIADGHHRFETAVTFMNECDARGWKPGAVESFDKRIVTCFNSAGQAITILPTHRLVRDLPDFEPRSFLKSAKRYFEVHAARSASVLWDQMKFERENHVFGFYSQRRFHLLRLTEEGRTDPTMFAHPEAYRDLDVSILHTLILEGICGIDEAKLVAQSHVDYAREREWCVRQVDEGKYQAAFFLNPTTVEQVQRVALLGERMPQKSTDFYPKLLSGLVFMKMSIQKPPERQSG